MKKLLLSIGCIFAGIFSTHAQTLFGTTSAGGNGGGTINKFIPATNTLSIAHSLAPVDHSPGRSNLIQANDGKLYGIVGGGANNDGALFSYDPSGATYTRLYDFDSANGSGPVGSLIQAADGKLYGMTAEGGSTNKGVIYSFDPPSSTYTKLKDFDLTNDGGQPQGGLIQATDGKLYGMTYAGGSGMAGVIFSFDPSTSAYIKLKQFNSAGDGGYPYGSLVQAADGKLYGMTSITYEPTPSGEAFGVIFSLDPSSATYTVLYQFNDVDGSHPRGSLIQASNGKLYGMTTSSYDPNNTDQFDEGFGVIFSFDPSSLTYVKLKEFNDTTGAYPYGDLLQATDGKLYGMTSSGGANGMGVLFSFDITSSTYAQLKDFDKANGDVPDGGLVQASDGKLYGLTSGGGGSYYHDGLIDGAGVIFSFVPSTSTYAKLHDFGSNAEGNTVSNKLLKATNGQLYGMTVGGGSNGYGVIFSIDPSTLLYTKLKDFDGVNGANPYGALIQASDGKLYGMTRYGGNTDSGVIFSFDPSTAAYTKLKDFNNADGANPYGSLLQADNGKLYGMTWGGGSSGGGVIFSFDPSSSVYTKFKDLDNASGRTPAGNLIQATNGKLYGMTLNGGSPSGSEGNIFLIDPVTAVFASLFSFTNAADGSNPGGSLFQAADGRLYGVTSGGGTNFNGVIFSFDPVGHVYTKLGDFDSINATEATGTLMQANDGKLYGTTGGAGTNVGAIFSFDPTTSSLVKLQDFNNANGASPLPGAEFIEVMAGPLPVTLISFTGKNTGNDNRLTWKADNELNLDHYELQRSSDGQYFTRISDIKAGNNGYTYDDPIATGSSVYYYRLKSVNKDGAFTYSAILKIQTNHSAFAVVSPNPFADKLVVSVESSVQDKALFIITDLNGRQLYRQNKLLFPGTNVIEIDEVNKFSKGTYVLTIMGAQQTQKIKVIKGN